LLPIEESIIGSLAPTLLAFNIVKFIAHSSFGLDILCFVAPHSIATLQLHILLLA
jgi:hypothetical protein